MSNSVSSTLPDSHMIAGGWEKQKQRQFVYGTLPAMVVLVAVTVVPALYLVSTSFTPLDLTRAYEPGAVIALVGPFPVTESQVTSAAALLFSLLMILRLRRRPRPVPDPGPAAP